MTPCAQQYGAFFCPSEHFSAQLGRKVLPSAFFGFNKTAPKANSYNALIFFTFFFFIADSSFFLFAFFLGPYSERNFF
jgi:hypothetical protein